jgi:hypothetical protein
MNTSSRNDPRLNKKGSGFEDDCLVIKKTLEIITSHIKRHMSHAVSTSYVKRRTSYIINMARLLKELTPVIFNGSLFL